MVYRDLNHLHLDLFYDLMTSILWLSHTQLTYARIKDHPQGSTSATDFLWPCLETRTPSTTTIMVPKHASAIQAFLDLSDLLKLKKGTLSLFQDDISRCTKMTLSLNRQLKILKIAIISKNWMSLELPEKCTWVATFIFGNKLTWDVRQKRRLSYPSLFHHVIISVLPVLQLSFCSPAVW